MIDVHETVFVGAGAVLTGYVTIDEGSSVWFNAVLRADLAPIRIGKNSAIEDNVVIHGGEAGPVEIAVTREKKSPEDDELFRLLTAERGKLARNTLPTPIPTA